MRVIGYVLGGLAAIVLLASLAFGLEWAGIAWKGFFGPKHEDVRRGVFQRTRSYNEAKEQQLLKLRLEYLRADEDDKKAIAGTIRHRFADYDETLLTPELRKFLHSIKYGQ